MGCPPLAPPAIFWLIHMEGLGWESELSALAESTPLPQKPSAPPPHTHTFRACPTHSPGPGLPETWLQGMAGGRKCASHSLTPEALLWGPHPITSLEGPLEKPGLGLGSTA